MGKLLTSRYRCYALALFLVGGGLALMGSSWVPTKDPPNQPGPSNLTIEPRHYNLLAGVQHTFTVTNNGPNPTGSLQTSLEIATPRTASVEEFPIFADTCNANVVPAGGTCTLRVSFEPRDLDPVKGAFLTVADGTDRAKATLLGSR